MVQVDDNMIDFKEIPNFPDYMINKNGKVYSKKTNKYLKLKEDRYGYYAVTLFKNGKSYYFTIHRLVAITFLKKPVNCNVVNHLDSNKKNNSVENLEWTTVSGNTKHCYENNVLFRNQVLNNCKKGSNTRKKKVNIKGIEFNSMVEASEYFKVNKKTIYNWLHKKVVMPCQENN